MAAKHPNGMRWLSVVVATMLLVCAAGAEEQQLKCPPEVTAMAIEKGEYSPEPGARFVLSNFAATLVARGKSAPLCFARTTEIKQGQVFVSAESLTTIFQRKLKEAKSSKVHDVRIEMQPGEVHIKGKMRKMIDIPFEIQGPVTTDGTVLKVTARKMKATGIPMKGLLDSFGETVGKMMDDQSAKGVSAKGDTLIFSPEQLSHVHGTITATQVTAKGLIVTFGKGAGRESGPVAANESKTEPETKANASAAKKRAKAPRKKTAAKPNDGTIPATSTTTSAGK